MKNSKSYYVFLIITKSAKEFVEWNSDCTLKKFRYKIYENTFIFLPESGNSAIITQLKNTNIKALKIKLEQLKEELKKKTITIGKENTLHNEGEGIGVPHQENAKKIELKGIENKKITVAVHFGRISYTESIKKQQELSIKIKNNKGLNNLSISYYSSTDSSNDFVKKEGLQYWANREINDINKFIKLMKLRVEGKEIEFFDIKKKTNKLIQDLLPLAIDIKGLIEVKENKAQEYFKEIKEDGYLDKIKTSVVEQIDGLNEILDENEKIKDDKKDYILNIIKAFKENDQIKNIKKKYLTPGNGNFFPEWLNKFSNKMSQHN
jgi:hypothetical protein